ncbi:MAG: hypothetical protein LQ347_000435 [Umbilicaria vellea]|nr:MAG: hypothetical protein LQ347_000435 [Umbilicaria vellea]
MDLYAKPLAVICIYRLPTYNKRDDMAKAAGLDDEAVIDAETAEEREEATDEGDGVGTEAVDDA